MVEGGFKLVLLARGNTRVAQKRTLLLDAACMAVQEIFDLRDTGDNYDDTLAASEAHFAPLLNQCYERHVFRPTSQE